MPNGDNEKIFGNSLESVNSKIAELEQERKDLADKVNAGNASRRENKRFGDLDGIIEQGNRFRTTFETVPGEENTGDNEFEIDKKTVIGEDKNPMGTGNQVTPQIGQGDVNPLGTTPISNIPQNVGNTGIQLGGGDLGTGVVPDITGGGAIVDPSDQIVSETIQGITRDDGGVIPDVESEINKSMFGSPESKGYPPVQKPGEAMALLDPSVSLGLNDPILKGNVGGQIIGSQPVFVGGGDFVAMHSINNRKKAIQDAALQRQQEKKDLMNQKPPLVKDQRFQGSLNNQFYGSINGMVDKAKEIYGEDWDLALKDQSNPLGREFVQTVSNYEFIAGQADQVTDLFAEIDADLESGDSVFSDETLQLRDDYNSLQNSFTNGEIGGVMSLSDEFFKLKGFTNLDKIIKDNDIDTKGTLTQYASILEDDDKYITTTQKKKAYEDQVHILAKGLADNQMRDAVRNGYITEEEIFERLNARYGYENIIDKKITTKPAGTGVKVEFDLSGEFGEPRKESFDTFDTFAYESVEVPTGVKPSQAVGLGYYDENGTLVQETGTQNVDWVSFQVIEVNDPDTGQPVRKKVIVGESTEKVPVKEGNQVKYVDKKVTKAYDLDQVESRLLTDKVVNTDQMEGINAKLDTKMQTNTMDTGVTSR